MSGVSTSVTPGGGSGCTLNLVAGISSIAVSTGGSGYTAEPKVTISLLAKTVASYDFWNKMRTSALLNTSSLGLSFILGSAAMNKLTFTIPVLQIEKCEYGDLNGILQVKLTCHPSQTSGNDWMSIIVDNA
jgi:hypothetical protein